MQLVPLQHGKEWKNSLRAGWDSKGSHNRKELGYSIGESLAGK
jgi:hypothetical protein